MSATTAIPTYIRHIRDRPPWQKEQVWIMDTGFHPALWQDESACRLHRLLAGSFETLRQYGTRQESASTGNAPPLEGVPGSALVYVDSKLLHACELVDLPGIRCGDGDDEAGSPGIAGDVLIYTSPASSQLHANDLPYLKELLKSLPALERNDGSPFPLLANLFVVMTQAGPNISDEDLLHVQRHAATKLTTELHESIWAPRYQGTRWSVTDEVIGSRVFPFWEESKARREHLEDALLKTLSGYMPRAMQLQADQRIRRFKAEGRAIYSRSIAAHWKTLADMDTARARSNNRPVQEELKRRLSAAEANVFAGIAAKRAAGEKFIKEDLAALLTSTELIRNFIEDRFNESVCEDPRKEAREYAPLRLLEDIQERQQNVLVNLARELEMLVEEYVQQAAEVRQFGTALAPGLPFDARRAFALGLSQESKLGALELWAKNLRNISDYHAVAELIVSSVGLKAASLALLAVFTPFTIGLGILAVATAELGHSWQHRMAKRLAHALKKDDVLQKYLDRNTEFWEDTKQGFQKGVERLSREFDAHLGVSNLLEEAGPASREHIEQRIAALEEQMMFFGGLPWNPVLDARD